MRVINAQFITSQVAYSPIDSLPEIAMAGRSNVGKSSLINMLTNTSKLAKTSDTPGRTRLINYFKCRLRNDSCAEGEQDTDIMLVDLPGYGFAKGSKSETAKWADMINEYLETSQQLSLVLVLVDIRHTPSDHDKMMINYLYAKSLPFIIVATKADKLSKAQRQRAVMDISSTLRVGKDNIIVTSAKDKTGSSCVLERAIIYINNN